MNPDNPLQQNRAIKILAAAAEGIASVRVQQRKIQQVLCKVVFLCQRLDMKGLSTGGIFWQSVREGKAFSVVTCGGFMTE